MAYERPFPHPSGAQAPAIPAEVMPRHVAVVMDGNGRWANERGLPRTKGHEAGEASLLDVVADRCLVFSESHQLVAEGGVAEVLGDRELLLDVNLVHQRSRSHRLGGAGA